MASFEIRGGNKLKGIIQPQGAKNEALQLISACLLSSEEVLIENIPDIRDVNKLFEILDFIGVKIQKREKGTFSFQADAVDLNRLFTPEYEQKANALRGSILLAGPLLARFGKAVVPQPGGDKIGRRRLDTHFIGFEKLGARLEYQTATMSYLLEADRLKGVYMLLDEASVTGTANLVMAASLARGKTIIFNAACEPYLSQLCKMLNCMGAQISGIGSNLLTIEGVDQLSGCTHRLLPDMIEVGSFIGLAAMTQSELLIKEVGYDQLGMIPEVFSRLGIQMQLQGDDLFIPQQDHYVVDRYRDGSILTISDAPWPGFTPDLISIALVVATQAKGSVLIHQKMFESRLFFVDKLIDMGAQIILCDPHRAVVIGADHQIPLRAMNMVSPDIRAGVSLLIAALSAEGVSRIDNIEQIDRGYEQIDVRLNKLGADIRRL